MKDENGNITVAELSDLSGEEAERLGPFAGDLHKVFGPDDVEAAANTLSSIRSEARTYMLRIHYFPFCLVGCIAGISCKCTTREELLQAPALMSFSLAQAHLADRPGRPRSQLAARRSYEGAYSCKEVTSKARISCSLAVAARKNSTYSGCVFVPKSVY